MTPGLRKLALTAHLTFSVGWIGAVVAYLALLVAAVTSRDVLTLRSAWIALRLVGLYAIAPLALASLLTGLVMALGTRWGLFRHYWVLASLALTLLANAVLLRHLQTVSHFAGVAAAADSADVGTLRGVLPAELLHAGVGLVVLLVIEALNVFKPQGLTEHGRRWQLEGSTADRPGLPGPAPAASEISLGGPPRWVYAVGIHAVGVVLLLAALHVAGGGMRSH